jgi:hypothetical protein
LDAGAVPAASTIRSFTMRIKMKGGDEFDGLSRRSKRFFLWRAGERKKLKRKYNKRRRKTFYDGGEIDSTGVQ